MMIEETKAVIFDLDGTLVDSMWMWKDIDIEFLKNYGHDCPPELQKEIEGMSFSETAVYFKDRFGLRESIEDIKAIWREMSIAAGIATSNGREMVDAVIHTLKIGDYFQVIATACEVAAGKPAPDIYLNVAGRLGVAPGKCLVFEDVPAGILAGKRAGMTVCAVDDEFSRHMEAEKKSLADYFIRDYYDIINRNGAAI